MRKNTKFDIFSYQKDCEINEKSFAFLIYMMIFKKVIQVAKKIIRFL